MYYSEVIFLGPTDNEIEHVVNVCVDARDARLSAAHAPRDQSDNIPPSGLGLTDKGGPTVTVAGVLINLSAGSHLGTAQPEVQTPN